MSETFYRTEYLSYCRTLENRGVKPMSFDEFVRIQRNVFVKDLPKTHGPVKVIL